MVAVASTTVAIATAAGPSAGHRMRFEALLHVVGDKAVFETSVLCAGGADRSDVERQLSRWTRAGKVIQLRRGLYTLSSPYRPSPPHPFVLANALVQPSYVSLESALAHHDLISEPGAVTMSVTTGRPGQFETPFGTYRYHHVKAELFWGFQPKAGSRDAPRVAAAEKALLDLVHLRAGSDSAAFLGELLMESPGGLDLTALREMAARTRSPKLMRAAAIVRDLARAGEGSETP